MKDFIVFWQRMANSGAIKVKANSAKDAIEEIGYSEKFVKMTAVEISGEILEVGQIG